MSIKITVLTSSITRAAGGLKGAISGLYHEYIYNFNEDRVIIFSYKDEFIDEEKHDWAMFELHLYDKTNFFNYSSKLREAILINNSDILHIHGLWMFPHLMSSVWKKKTNKPVIITPHGMLDPYIINNQHPLKKKIANLLFAKNAFEKANCFHALCQSEYDAIRSYGIKQPIAIIPNGVNLPDSNRKIIKKDNYKHLLFLGRLHPKKGVDILLEAFGEINREEPKLFDNWVLDIVGWAQEGFDSKLRSIVKYYDLEDKVIFHGGLFGDNKQYMYSQADAYILPSHGEGLPLTVLEAWAFETPVLMTPFCNIPKGFEVNAAIKIENTKDSVKEGLLKLLETTEAELKIMGLNGKKLVEDEFTWDAAALKMNSVYKWLLNLCEKPDFIYLD
jgi:glycosyltransferase involved in cell wall biosynthesis